MPSSNGGTDAGVDGSACTIGHLFKLGGEHRFTGDLNVISGKNYNWERYLRISNIVERADKLGMKMYLGFYFANSLNTRTPLAEWFDDAAWSKTVLPEIKGAGRRGQGARLRRHHVRSGALPQNDGRPPRAGRGPTTATRTPKPRFGHR